MLDVGGAIMGGLSILSDSILGGLNYASQAEQQAWERKMYKNSLSREDSAIQRRVADLKAAGLSPVLAAGSGAQSMAPIRSTAPQFETGQVSKAAQMMAINSQLMQQQANIEKTKQESELIKLQKDRVMADTVGQQLINQYTKDSMGNRLSKLDLEVQLARETNPKKIDLMAIDIRRGNIKAQQDEVDLQLKKIGITHANQQTILNDLKKRLSTNDLDKQVEDIIAKKILVDTLRKENTLVQRKLDSNTATNSEMVEQVTKIIQALQAGKNLFTR